MKTGFYIDSMQQTAAAREADVQPDRQADRCTGRHLALLCQLLSNCELSSMFGFVTVLFAQPQSAISIYHSDLPLDQE